MRSTVVMITYSRWLKTGIFFQKESRRDGGKHSHNMPTMERTRARGNDWNSSEQQAMLVFVMKKWNLSNASGKLRDNSYETVLGKC